MIRFLLALVCFGWMNTAAYAWEGAELEAHNPTGQNVLVICLFGERDTGIVPAKCVEVMRDCAQRFGARFCVRLDNPPERNLERIARRYGQNIGTVIVVTHSTPSTEEECGYDVWDCPMSPSDISEIFEDIWVIWNGCFSRGICELDDNILPTQPENMVLPSSNNNYQDILECLHRHHGEPQTRDEICEEVFGEAYSPDEEEEVVPVEEEEQQEDAGGDEEAGEEEPPEGESSDGPQSLDEY